VLKIQDGFIELLIPAACDLPLDIDTPTVIPTLDQMLPWRPDSVVRLAPLVNHKHADRDETMETTANSSRRVSRLLGMLGWEGRERIVEGHVRRLRIDAQEGLDVEDEDLQPIRAEIVRFLLANTSFHWTNISNCLMIMYASF
ncbi:hypothetical protein FRC06_002689, partial [Ceratobasidium sp. 370]